MKLSLWTYEGPPHVGAMRVATGLDDVHFVLHAPQGDTYADLLFTMIERRKERPPVTFTTFQARDLSRDTADLFRSACESAYDRYQPGAMLVGASCTAELIQDDPGGLAEALGLPVPVIPLELPSYQRKENFGASETLYQLVRRLAEPCQRTEAPSCNIIGPSALGFRHRDDVKELAKLLASLGVGVNAVAPMGADVADLRALPAAHFNVMLYPEIAETTCRWLERSFDQPYTKTVPIGLGATRDFVAEVAQLIGTGPLLLNKEELRMSWWSASVDSTYLTGKRVFIFGDATHAMALARVAQEELAFEVVGLGCYNREFARPVRQLAEKLGIEALITDDYLEVEARIEQLQPELLLGTQMERHIGKRLGIPCAVISAPVHVQDYPARYSPLVGIEGANVLFDTLVHPLVMGLEEHLLHMFRDDFEFNDAAGPSHYGGAVLAGEGQPQIPTTQFSKTKSPKEVSNPMHVPPDGQHFSTDNHQNSQSACGQAGFAGIGASVIDEPPEMPISTAEQFLRNRPSGLMHSEGLSWSREAEQELKKIPFFVRGKARRNTESFALSCGHQVITLDILYEAKAHYAR